MTRYCLRVTNTFDPTTGVLFQPRSSLTATLLASGRVVLTGGTVFPVASVEIFDPSTSRFASPPQVPPLLQARRDHTATLLPSGQVLVIGGGDLSSSTTVTETYLPIQP